ncbi:unnamed protein product [Acanthoscelides obtectus]|uniref:Uncharacterized protein n=1 Tax=Acanthoscelides obtectus TaxID=200917 RepID=A0A9P0M9C3_ACAOB|nr:unnamed protein product [Acanthoscelides obtectus]CAK1626969.1 hypothetical protein AOBTE_LOCUS4182 [Acanthoscelides obtectus]
MAESSGSVVVSNNANTAGENTQTRAVQSTDSTDKINNKTDKESNLPPADGAFLSTMTVSMVAPPEATSIGTTGQILDLNLNNTNGDPGTFEDSPTADARPFPLPHS